VPESPQVAKWQHKLDATFPHGAVGSWMSARNDTVYRIPRVEVIGTEGLDPVLRMGVDGAEKVLGPWRCTSYQQEMGGYHLTFAEVPDTMMLTAAPESMGLTPEHDSLESKAPDGGRAVFEDPANV
jgi:hypothetical protein